MIVSVFPGDRFATQATLKPHQFALLLPVLDHSVHGAHSLVLSIAPIDTTRVDFAAAPVLLPVRVGERGIAFAASVLRVVQVLHHKVVDVSVEVKLLATDWTLLVAV